MPTHNAIVGKVVRITPSVTKKGEDMLREVPPEGFSIEFEGNQVAKLPSDEKAAGVLEILEELRKMAAPVYVDIHPDNKVIIQLLIPLVGKVTSISEVKGDQIHVEMEISSARHVVNLSNPDFNEIMETLKTAIGSKTHLIVTETDKHEIIDARQLPAESGPFIAPEVSKPVKSLKKKIFKFWWPFCCNNAITETIALAMFNMVGARTCDPLTVPAPCIPFLYPDDGCWGRAHEMYRLIMDAGVVSKKVWIYGNLQVNTKNNPNCKVFWGWHVAPTVCIKGSGWLGWLFSREKVIDPSLFTLPVLKSIWKGVQNDPNAQLVDTDGSIYYHTLSGFNQTDPTYSNTVQVLATYRLKLKIRSLQIGPPPYVNCP